MSHERSQTRTRPAAPPTAPAWATLRSRRERAPGTTSLRDLPREHRLVQVFRTRGRGLVAEYDPA